MGQTNIFKWITIPPVVAIITIMVARSMGGGQIVGEVDLSIWALVWLMFIVMSVLYGLFIINGFNIGLISLQALTQGILLCPMSIVYGARMFQWLGVVLAVCGGAALVVAYNQAEGERNRPVVVEVEDDIKRLPINFAITDDTGAILNLSEDMLDVLGLSRLDSIGKNISEWFSPVSKTAEIGGKVWDVQRKSLENGTKYYFELRPKGLPVGDETSESDDTGIPAEPAQFIDADTQLHTYMYGITRMSDELYRAGRYGRAVSAVMIRIVFPQLLPNEDMHKYTRPFRAYCARVKKNIRQSDTAIQTGEFQIMVMLSECSFQMVDEVTSRLVAIVNALAPTFEEFLNVTVLHVSESLDSNTTIPTAQELLDRMTREMTRKYSATALSQ